jgi:hypothetical protein
MATMMDVPFCRVGWELSYVVSCGGDVLKLQMCGLFGKTLGPGELVLALWMRVSGWIFSELRNFDLKLQHPIAPADDDTCAPLYRTQHIAHISCACISDLSTYLILIISFRCCKANTLLVLCALQ